MLVIKKLVFQLLALAIIFSPSLLWLWSGAPTTLVAIGILITTQGTLGALGMIVSLAIWSRFGFFMEEHRK